MNETLGNELSDAWLTRYWTVLALMGHADLESAVRYLQPAAAPEMREKLNEIDW